MEWRRPIGKAITGLRRAESALSAELLRVRRILTQLERGEAPKLERKARADAYRLSKAGRASISRAATKRWAKYRKQKAAAK